jgi:hypothetical protein
MVKKMIIAMSDKNNMARAWMMLFGVVLFLKIARLVVIILFFIFYRVIKNQRELHCLSSTEVPRSTHQTNKPSPRL